MIFEYILINSKINYGKWYKDPLVWAKTVHSVLLATQKVIDSITDDKKTITIIYGAHGCVVFGGEGKQVAPRYFSGVYDSQLHLNPKVKKIYFTALKDQFGNYDKFCEALGQEFIPAL